MANYILAQENGRTKFSNPVWYVMQATDLATLVSDETVLFGCLAYIIKAGTMAIYGNDGKWYDMSGNEVSTS